MGLGPSIKMTTLHHYNCPVVRQLMQDCSVDFAGVIVSGVSERYDDKLASAVQTGKFAEALDVDGALVAIDGWGNHHIDFISVIEQLETRGIPTIGLSFLGQQGRLVCSNPYVGTIIDFNKSTSGYESCIVGDNNLDSMDAYKALGLLKHQMPRNRDSNPAHDSSVNRYITPVIQVDYGKKTEYSYHTHVLTLNLHEAIETIASLHRLKQVTVSVIRPDQRHRFVNSILDFQPIARKLSGELGSGETLHLSGITAMLTGVEDTSRYQPANIGSSEGFLDQQVKFNQAGTPKESDLLLHIDCLFHNGMGRTAAGILEAHIAADLVLNEIRRGISRPEKPLPYTSFSFPTKQGKPRVVLIKLVSGLGAMYDTALFPEEPGGCIGSRMMRERKNMPQLLTPAQCLDGAIHSFL